ncbi:MAG: hypothetical protein NVS4B2_23230 [Chloroflexota bacterium]
MQGDLSSGQENLQHYHEDGITPPRAQAMGRPTSIHDASAFRCDRRFPRHDFTARNRGSTTLPASTTAPYLVVGWAVANRTSRFAAGLEQDRVWAIEDCRHVSGSNSFWPLRNDANAQGVQKFDAPESSRVERGELLAGRPKACTRGGA